MIAAAPAWLAPVPEPHMQDHRTYWLDAGRATHRLRPAGPGYVDAIRHDGVWYRLTLDWGDVCTLDPNLPAELFKIADDYANAGAKATRPRPREILATQHTRRVNAVSQAPRASFFERLIRAFCPK